MPFVPALLPQSRVSRNCRPAACSTLHAQIRACRLLPACGHMHTCLLYSNTDPSSTEPSSNSSCLPLRAWAGTHLLWRLVRAAPGKLRLSDDAMGGSGAYQIPCHSWPGLHTTGLGPPELSNLLPAAMLTPSLHKSTSLLNWLPSGLTPSPRTSLPPSSRRSSCRSPALPHAASAAGRASSRSRRYRLRSWTPPSPSGRSISRCSCSTGPSGATRSSQRQKERMLAACSCSSDSPLCLKLR